MPSPRQLPLIQGLRIFTAVVLLLICAHQLPAVAETPPAGSGQKVYVCPPCGQPCDSLVFDKPGKCPKCGMTLVAQSDLQAQTSAQDTRKKIAILIFDGVQIIDFTGPYEMFGAAGFNVYTVAQSKNPVTTSMGMTVVPKYSFADLPQPDLLVIPGGGVYGGQHDPIILQWVKDMTARVDRTMSVCNGAFILASAGLLDGLTATTTNGNIERLRSEFPKITVVRQRFVDNGKIITTAGLTAGIDGALHVISKISGIETARQVAASEEYNWQPK